MKRILLIGNCPLPNENAKKRPSEGLRTWQFLSTLRKGGLDGGDVCGGSGGLGGGSSTVDDGLGGSLGKSGDINLRLVTLGLDDCYDESVIPQGSLRKDTKVSCGAGGREVGVSDDASGSGMGMGGGSSGDFFIHHQISENHPELFKILQSVIDEFVPDAIVAVNTFAAYAVSRLKFNCLFWADLGGWTMAKAQSEAFKTGSDKRLSYYLGIEERILDRADVVSVASDASKYAVLGELAMMKKMGVSEFGRDAVVTIESGLEDFESDLVDTSVGVIKKPPTVDNAWSAGTFEKVQMGIGGIASGSGGGFGGVGGRKGGGINYFRGEGSFTGADIPHNAFVILWLGSYSSWVDEESLFKAVEAAVKESEGVGEEVEIGSGLSPAGRGLGSQTEQKGAQGVRRENSARRENVARRKIYFVSTGGLSEEPNLAGIVGGGRAQLSFFPPLSRHEPANKTYLKFKEMIGLSQFQDRFVFLGWVPAKHIPYLYNEADMGINVDRKCLQTLTDSRNRLLEMMKFRLPVVTTLGTELSWRVDACGSGLGVASGDVNGLKEAILELYKNPARRKDYGDKGRRFVEQYCSYEQVMRPFAKWVEGVEGKKMDEKMFGGGEAGGGASGGGWAGGCDAREHKKIEIGEITKTLAKGSRFAFGAMAGAAKTASSVAVNVFKKFKK